MQLKIAFVILTWNSETYISNCLNSLSAIENLSTSIYVVDNGSADQTKHIIASDFPNVTVIALDSNIGTTKPRNIALKKIPADTDFICVLDSDTVVNSAAIHALIEALSRNRHYGVAVPSMVNANQEPQTSCKQFPNLPIKFLKPMPLKKLEQIGKHMENYDFSSNQSIFEVDYGISACWMIKKSCFDAVGLLDENIFYAPEDVDYCLRTWKAGFKVIYVPNAHIVHDTQRISRKKYVSRINYEHIKGLLYFFHKHGYWFRRPRFK